jgi:hypothetical protein
MARRRKTGLTGSEWKAKFAQAAKWCAHNKAPGERIQDCIRRYLKGGGIALKA